MPKTPQGLRTSALNRLRYGCDVDAILPCKRYDCIWAEGCRLDPHTRKHGWPPYGDECHLERREYDAYILSARRTYYYAKAWLSEDEFETIIERLALLRLRARRTVSRLSDEGLVHYVSLSDGRKLHREPIASRRYLASVNHQTAMLMDRLSEEPETKQERLRRAKMRPGRNSVDKQVRDKCIITAMIANGYYRPCDGDQPPIPDEAPAWIIRAVDAKMAAAGNSSDHTGDRASR